MENTLVKNKQRTYFANNLKEILDQAKQVINVNKQLHPTSTLITTFLDPARERNSYVWFGFIPQTICYHTWGKVLVSINDDMINVNKQVNNQQR